MFITDTTLYGPGTVTAVFFLKGYITEEHHFQLIRRKHISFKYMGLGHHD